MKLIRIRLAQPILHAAALAAFFMPMSSIAQPVCGDRSGLLTRLGEKFHEVPVALGLAASGQVVEVLTSPSGSWSIIVTHPQGRSCLMGAGQGWQDLPRPHGPGDRAAKGPGA
jgi:hypothetical protein